MSEHDRLTALYGPHAVLHRHRRTHTARPNPERTMKPSSKQINGVMGGQGRPASEVHASAEAVIVLLMTVGVVALIVILGHVAGWLA